MSAIQTVVLRACAMLSVSQPAFYALVPIVLLISILVFISFTHKTRSTKKPKDNTLQHLVSVLVPTRVSWEHQYSQLFNYTKSERKAVIWISLSSLVQGLCNGSLELRNEQDLQALISGRLRVSSGWAISLKIEFSWWLRLFYRFSLDKCHLGPCRARGAGAYMRNSTSESRPPQDLIKFSQATAMLSEYEDGLSNALCYDLDMVFYSHIKSIIYDVRRSQIKTNSITILEFTTLGLHVSYLSSLYLACAVPFLEDESRSGKRTLTPLHLSLRHVIELLSDAGIEIRSVCDVSLMHAEELRKHSRHRMIKKGMQKEGVLLTWEAALLTEGHLVRWRVCCTYSRRLDVLHAARSGRGF